MDNTLEGPLPIFPIAVLFKKGFEPLLSVPLEVIGEHAEEDMGTDAVVLFVIDGADCSMTIILHFSDN